MAIVFASSSLFSSRSRAEEIWVDGRASAPFPALFCPEEVSASCFAALPMLPGSSAAEGRGSSTSEPSSSGTLRVADKVSEMGRRTISSSSFSLKFSFRSPAFSQYRRDRSTSFSVQEKTSAREESVGYALGAWTLRSR